VATSCFAPPVRRVLAFGLSVLALSASAQPMAPVREDPDRDSVMRAVAPRMPRIRRCYEERAALRGHIGRVAFRLRVQEDGTLTDVRPVADTLGDGGFVRGCVLANLHGLRTDVPPANVRVLTIPFVFAPEGDEHGTRLVVGPFTLRMPQAAHRSGRSETLHSFVASEGERHHQVLVSAPADRAAFQDGVGQMLRRLGRMLSRRELHLGSGFTASLRHHARRAPSGEARHVWLAIVRHEGWSAVFALHSRVDEEAAFRAWLATLQTNAALGPS